eukprot:11129257-Lingulodinium_polyedra.AAC.1
MLDRCIRWRAAKLIESKEEDNLMKAIDVLWMSIQGPPKELITDSESGIVFSEKTREYIARAGTKLRPRAKDQHA